MKILIGCGEVAGLIYELGKEFEKQGHDVTTIAAPSNVSYYNYSYDINPNEFLKYYLKKYSKWPKLTKFIYLLIGFFSLRFQENFRVNLLKKFLLDSDLFIFIWTSLLWEEDKLIKFLYKKNIPIITLFLGSEIRDYKAFQLKYSVTQWDFPKRYFSNSPNKIKKLRLHEKYSTLIYSVPDQSIHAKTSYCHLQLPFDLEKFNYNVPERDIPVVIHCPSEPFVKGTDIIEETLLKLKNEGILFEFKFLKNISHKELLLHLSEADVLIDEIVLHGPGMLGFEGMLSGCAVATKFLKSSPKCFSPPVYNIDHTNIYLKMKSLLSDKKLRVKLAQEGREYAVKNNNIEKVSKNILNNLEKKKFDFIF